MHFFFLSLIVVQICDNYVARFPRQKLHCAVLFFFLFSSSNGVAHTAPSPHQELFAVGSSFDVSTIVNTNIQGPCPVAVNTVDREVYWYSSSKQLLRGYFDSNVVQVWCYCSSNHLPHAWMCGLYRT